MLVFTINTSCDRGLALTTASPAAHFPAFTELPLPIWLHLNAHTTTSKKPTNFFHLYNSARCVRAYRKQWLQKTSLPDFFRKLNIQCLLFQTPQLYGESSCWINCVTLKRTHTHKKHTHWHLAWSLAFLSIVWYVDRRLDGVTAGRRAPLPCVFRLGPAAPPTSFPLVIYHLLPPLFLYNSLSPLYPPDSTSAPRHQPLHPFFVLRSPPPSFIWIPQWGLFVQWLSLHCAAKGSRVNGQANEFSPSPNCGVRMHTHTHAHAHQLTHTHKLSFMLPYTNIHAQTHAPIQDNIFLNWTSFFHINYCFSDLWPGNKGETNSRVFTYHHVVSRALHGSMSSAAAEKDVSLLLYFHTVSTFHNAWLTACIQISISLCFWSIGFQ